MTSRLVWVACLLTACADAPASITLDFRQPSDRSLFASVQSLELRATREGRLLAQSTFPATATELGLSRVSYGANTIFTLDGLSSQGDIVAHGSTCAIDFEAATPSAQLYFAPTHLFAPTPGAPPAVRTAQMAIVRGNGDVLLAGGVEGGAAVASVMRYLEPSASFEDSTRPLSTPRAGGQVSSLGIGALLTGGVDASGARLASAELFLEATGTFQALENQALGARAAHGAIVLPGDRVLLTGGFDAMGQAVATTAVINVQPDGSAVVAAGPPLEVARAAHAMVLAVGTPVAVGGYDTNHQPLASIEALGIADDGDLESFQTIAYLQFPRAEATATLLGNGSILIVGGVDASNAPRGDAEVYNPITQTTHVYSLAEQRRGHTATALPDGNVLIVGGTGADGAPLSSVELFVPDVGFVSERPLLMPRVGHVAVPLCDGTVLIEGGASDAELYTPAPSAG